MSAFEALLTEKRYEQLTVQDIIDRANVGRSTFYAHFETKDDLLKYTCQELFEHIFTEHPLPDDSHDYSESTNTQEVMLTHILMRKRRPLLEILSVPVPYPDGKKRRGRPGR